MSKPLRLASFVVLALASCLTAVPRETSSAPSAPATLHALATTPPAAEKTPILIDKASAVECLVILGYDAWNEALHGIARHDGVTAFPQPIGLANMWAPELLHDVATANSTGARALDNRGSFGLTLWSPVINIARDSRGGRTQEAYGREPYLAPRMAVA